MNCQCNKCEGIFEAKGMSVLEVLSGGKDCPNCDGKVNLIITKREKGKK